MRFRIITYNIHKGIGGIDRHYRLERIIETIAHYSPDIVLLQEVDDGVPRSRHDRQVEILAEALGFPHHAYQRNVHLKKGHYGNAVLSRYPLRHTGHVDLSVPMKKRRQALVTRCLLSVEGHQRTAIITNVHLGLSSIERRIQLRRLLSHVLLTRHERHTPILVGGDFNDVWNNLGKRVMYPAGYSSAGRMIRTFPARMPMRPLDHIFVRGTLSVENAYAGHTRLATAASDHLPLVAEVRVELRR
ncbi:MAG: endonuclease/exonuclease/phosphatase family protein [Pirellulaceae bacterium]